jgi:hypothetical protein
MQANSKQTVDSGDFNIDLSNSQRKMILNDEEEYNNDL